MKLNQTIAMAQGVLAEGRMLDAARMIEPLIELSNGRLDTDQVMLRCLMARVRLLRNGDVRTVMELLRSYDESEARAALEPYVRSEVALWLGWAHAWREEGSHDDARALSLLDEAERGFRNELVPSGLCWTLIGQAHAYATIDETQLMLRALEEAEAIQEQISDRPAETWIHYLSAMGARLEGHYRRALRRLDELERSATALHDELSLGRAHAQRALVLYELGRRPATIVETAEQAERLLLGLSDRPDHTIADAYEAYVGALVRAGEWTRAERTIDRASAHVTHLVEAEASLQLHRARIRLRRGETDAAASVLEDLLARTHRRHRHLLSKLHRAYGATLLAQDRIDQAFTYCDKALRISREVGRAGGQLSALLQLAETAVAAGDADRASAALREAELFADYFSMLPFAARRFVIEGHIARLRHREEEARAHLAQAGSAYSLIGDVYLLATVQHGLALLKAPSAPEDARALAEAALSAFQSIGAVADVRRIRKLLRQWPAGIAERVPNHEAEIGSILARAAISVDLVAEAWLQAAEKLAPNRWLVVYRYDEPGDWTLVHRHGEVPGQLRRPDPQAERVCEHGVDWLRLRGFPSPVFFFGMECGGEDDPACEAIEHRLLPWIPVAGLAFDHALLRAARLGARPGMAGAAHEESSPILDGLVISSRAMQRLVESMRRIRSSHGPVLVTGESGTGKNLIARAIHDVSDRRDGPFVVFSCSNVRDEMIESRLFGFAGTSTDHPVPALRAANGGTLVLDEIADLPVEVQPKLLRFLEDGATFEAGTERAVDVDVRVVATTTRDPSDLLRTGRLREDLYYRLNVIPLRVPPLRERREEIPLLVHHFFRTLPSGSPNPSITNRALDALIRYNWPGNVRQLRNEVERLLALYGSEPVPMIDVHNLSEPILQSVSEKETSSPPAIPLQDVFLDGHGLDDMLAQAEATVIREALARNDGQVSAAADSLGVSRQGLYKKMKRLGVDPSRLQTAWRGGEDVSDVRTHA